MDFTKLEKLIDELTVDYLPSIDCAVYKGYERVFRYYSGYADREAGIPIKGDEYYFIYSLTKVFTATATLQLLEQGKILLNDPVCRYLPEYDERITIKQLLSMSGGFDYDLHFADKFVGTDTSTRDVLRSLPLKYAPGEGWTYSLCHDVLAVLIEAVSGMKYSEYLKRNIFDPLGMEHTGFRLDDYSKMAAQYRWNWDTKHADRIEKVNGYVGLSNAYESGGAGLISTLDDLCKFFPVMTSGGTSKDGVRILGQATIDLMRQDFLNDDQKKLFWKMFPQCVGYSYGLGVRTFIDPRPLGEQGSIGEFGWNGAAGVFALMDPAKDVTLVYEVHVLESEEYVYPMKMKNVFYGCL